MRNLALALLLCGMGAAPSMAQSPSASSDATWTLGAFADLGYLFDPNRPPDRRTRSRGTSFHVNELSLNMAGISAARTPTDSSRWGSELAIHAGKDDEAFALSPTAPALDAAPWLRHLGRANVSYLAPAGNGLLLQAGIFASPIGYDSLYAKDNLSYTRPWTADFTPYLLMGLNAAYPVSTRLTMTGFVVNGYWHLANANRAPNAGMQLSYASTPTLTIKQTMFVGSHQERTEFAYWRFLSDTIIERRTKRWIAALNAQVATERVDDATGVRAWWLAAQWPIHWRSSGAWSVTARPEIAWDSGGRWTAFEQTVAAFTGTIDYRRSLRGATALVRLEYRTDSSTGPQGGFFSSEAGRLTPTQHLLIAALILTFERR